MILEKFKTIPGYDTWKDAESLNKGFSGEQKYIITDNDGNKFLLRVSKMETYEEKKKQYELLQKVEKLNINSSKPICFGKLSDEEVYMVLSWVEGEDAEVAVKNLTDKEAYLLGIETGKVLARLHEIPVDANSEKVWIEKFKAKMERKYKALDDSGLEIPNKEKVIKFVEDNMHLLENRRQTFTHGDYHLANLIVNNGKIGVIDFEKNKISDPYDDLKPFMWNVFVSEYFETGMINGYFNNNIPSDFFPILKVYAAENLVSFLPWAAKIGGDNLKTAYKINASIMEWYDNFDATIPSWYKGVLEFND